MNYYNELDPDAAQWLRNLITAGLIPAGEVDERSIEYVQPCDLRGFTQCHFFAGIGGWSHALVLARWPADRPVWTGSCPCQSFSAAGKGAGFADERHLWPAWFHLISQCRPPIVFGEQVASAVGHGWLDLVQTDLEGKGYAVGSAVLGAHSVGAPHQRQRLWFVAHADSGQRDGVTVVRGVESNRQDAGRAQGSRGAGACGEASELANADDTRPQGRDESGQRTDPQRTTTERSGEADGIGPTSPLHGFWADADWILCRDGKWRPVEPGAQPLANGIPGRVVKLRAYGNAIVPQVGAQFIKASCLN